jgi:uncharacterized membrane protein YhaH (DUF805 family)
MATIPFRRYLPILIHVLCWQLFLGGFLFYHPITRQLAMPGVWWLKQVLFAATLIGVFYLNTGLWVPRLLLRGRNGWYALAVLGAVLFVWGTHRLADDWLNLPRVMHEFFNPGTPVPPPKGGGGRFWDSLTILMTLFVLGIGTSLLAVQRGQQETAVRQALEKEKVSSELSFLRAQINPHFFFNTLNNIYALTLLDGDLARDAIHRLSRLMRYVLYDSGAGTVRLSQEIAFVQDYIQLMQLRLTDKVRIELDAPAPERDVPIAPMLVLPFVENAFKHGVSATEPSQIFVGIRQRAESLDVEVRNTLVRKTGESLEASNGIGLANTRRRLDLLYPDRHRLRVHETDAEYLVYLSLDLS